MLKYCLALLILLPVPTLVLAQGEFSDALSTEYQQDYDMYQRVNEMKQVHHPVIQENSLRSSLMLLWYRDDMEKRLAWVQRQNWTKNYKAMFARAAQWRKTSFDGGANKLYRLAHKYRQVPNAEKYGYDDLSLWLLYFAAMAGHSKAYSEYKDHPSKPSNAILLMQSRVHKYENARNGDPQAIDSLAITYLLSPIFDDDRLKGYYWYNRSHGMDLSKKNLAKLEKALSFVSAQERQLAEEWSKSGFVPPM